MNNIYLPRVTEFRYKVGLDPKVGKFVPLKIIPLKMIYELQFVRNIFICINSNIY